VAAAHTIPRELRAFGNYRPDPASGGDPGVPVLMLVGSDSEPPRRRMFEAFAGTIPRARRAVLPGQRHAAHQTAPQLLAATLHDILLAAGS
jgi:pimeloyl-ACP methyl ester carboxylesterase